MIAATVSGNLGKDATLRQAGNTDVCSFSVASTDKVKGEKITTWVDATIWGARGVALVQYLTKGTKVAVSGGLSTREHDGKTYLQIRVDQVDLLGGGDRQQAPAPRREPTAPSGSNVNDGYGDAGGHDDDIPF
jgi:single-strand DNA-binding protein